jgi:hypothetical protein
VSNDLYTSVAGTPNHRSRIPYRKSLTAEKQSSGQDHGMQLRFGCWQCTNIYPPLSQQSLASRPSNSRSGNPGFPAIPALRHTSPRPSSSTVSHVSLSGPRQASRIAPSFPAQGPTLSMPNFDTPSTRKRSSSDSVFYSFDILRSDPSSLSLQHIASSATYPNRGAPPSSHNSRPSPGDGSTSAFRVAVAAIPYARKHSAAPPHERRGSTPSSANHSEPARMRIDSDSGPGCSSIISFPVFGSAVLRKNYSGDITDSDDDELSTSNSGKRHVCPTCFKRFNRPSSLKIHVNTHTGATRTCSV